MHPEIQSLLDLPTATLVTLGAGYMGYRLAYIGKDESHKMHHVVFISLIFGLIAQITQDGMLIFFPGLPALLIVSGSLAMTLLISTLWRRFGEGIAQQIFRKISGSHHDGHKTAWHTILATEGKNVTSCMVCLKNGTSLMCERIADFEGAKIPRITLGSDGSIALYVTHILKSKDQDWKEVEDVSHMWGDNITYIPTEEILAIDIRICR